METEPADRWRTALPRVGLALLLAAGIAWLWLHRSCQPHGHPAPAARLGNMGPADIHAAQWSHYGIFRVSGFWRGLRWHGGEGKRRVPCGKRSPPAVWLAAVRCRLRAPGQFIVQALCVGLAELMSARQTQPARTRRRRFSS